MSRRSASPTTWLRRPRRASQSSNSGCFGFLPVVPKLFGLPARGVPIVHCQMRFAITRAVSGFFPSAIHSASAFRRPLDRAGNDRVAGRARGLRASPLLRAERVAAGQDVRRVQLAFASRFFGTRTGAETAFTLGVCPAYTDSATVVPVVFPLQPFQPLAGDALQPEIGRREELVPRWFLALRVRAAPSPTSPRAADSTF